LSHGTTYTESGRKRSLTYPDGSTYEYSYNDANRIQSMDLPDSGQITWGEYEWRRPTSVSLPGGASKSFDLDPLQRIKKITSRDPAGNTILHREYDYDKAGNIVSEQTGEGRHDYGYDPLDRLTSAENPALQDEEYSYDAVGNRLTSADTNGTWSYNANNELLAYNNATCSFDDNGNMVKRVVDGKVTRYIYNANNRLVRVEDGSGDVIAEYYYDPFGRRLWKEVNGERTYFHYSEQGLIAEYDDRGDPIRFYGYKPGSSWTTDPVFLKKNREYYFYHNDHLGTPQKLTASNGKVVWSSRYASFGGTQLVEKEIKNPLRFPGQYYDEETGLHYNYHRYYDPEIGRYLRDDPIGLEGGINLFAYSENTPLKYIDYFGLRAQECPDCPKGEWRVDVGGTFTGGVIIGGSRSRVTFTCLSSSSKCSGVIDCKLKGLFAYVGFDWSIDFESIGEGSKVEGRYNNSDIRNYTYKDFIMMAGPVSTTGGNLSPGVSYGGGFAWLDCTAKLVVCD